MKEERKLEMIREVYTSEILSILLDIIAGILLTVLILPFKSFAVLILMVPGLLSVRGNIGGAFAGRNAKNLFLGNFGKKTLLENALASFFLTLTAGIILGTLSVILNIFLFKIPDLNNASLFFLPILTFIFNQLLSFSLSSLFSYSVFKLGFNPNNIVSPIMTGVDDILIVLFFYVSIILLGVS